MKRNQLKLRIWVVLNNISLSTEKLEYLEQELDDIELGALISLCSDSRDALTLLDEYNSSDVLDCSRLKDTAIKYHSFNISSSLFEVRARLCVNDLEDMIHSQADVLEAKEFAPCVLKCRLCLLDYARMLRCKIDTPEISLDMAEERLLSSLKDQYDGKLLFDAFSVLLMGVDAVSDVDALAEIFLTHKVALSEYLCKQIDIEYEDS